MFRAAFLALPLVLAPVALPLPVMAAAEAQSRTGETCDQQGERRRRRGRGIGGVLGGIAGGLIGGPVGTVTSVIPVGSVLGETIASLLDCREQQQAVEASNQAVRGGVGTTAGWNSETRQGVSGSSAATGEETLADGTHCMTVTDIVIVEGEETRAPKRMCRSPGAARYARV